MAQSKPSEFIVLWDDGTSVCCPMAADPECLGGLLAGTDRVVVFDSRQDARRAIAISTARERLYAVQGHPANDDFVTGKRHLRIVPLVRWGR